METAIRDGVANGAVADRDRSGRFIAGNTARDAKRRRIAAKIRELTAEYDASTPARRMMLRIAAGHLDTAENARRAVTRVRSANAAMRCLASIPRLRKRRPTLRELGL